MLMQIRRGVFETNSSSMHSLAVIGADRMASLNFKTVTINEVEKIKVIPDEYGWSADPCVTPLEKLSYIVTQIRYRIDENENDKPSAIANSHYFKWLSEMVCDYTGYPLHYEPLNGQYSPCGYIDHQSVGTVKLPGTESEFKAYTRDLVFNDKYFIVIDHDN